MLGRKRSIEEMKTTTTITTNTSAAETSAAAAGAITVTMDDDNNNNNNNDNNNNDNNDDTVLLLSKTLSVISKLKLEAIFHPKFENENVHEQYVRKRMMDHVASERGYVEVSIKHSGSLLLWSGGYGNRFYSKNSTDNKFSMTGEILLRQHFVRSYWNNNEKGEGGVLEQQSQKQFNECSEYVVANNLTLAFEVVTAVLGDHGERPKRDFLVLTAVAEKRRAGTGTTKSNEQQQEQRFYTTTELIEFAHKFRLPHNDCFIFTTIESVNALFQFYDDTKSTGMASTVISALQQKANAYVSSMYDHVTYQGEIIEGIVVRYVPNNTIGSGGSGGGNNNNNNNNSNDDNNDGCCSNPLETMERLSKDAIRINNSIKDLPDCYDLIQLSSQHKLKTNGQEESSSSSSPVKPCYPPVLSTNIRTVFEQEGDKRNHRRSDDGSSDNFECALREVLKQSGHGRHVRRQQIQGKRTTIQHLLPIEDLARSPDKETRSIATVMQKLLSMGASVGFSFYREEEECRSQTHGDGDTNSNTSTQQQQQENSSSSRLLMVIHVHNDSTFQKFEKTRASNQMKLFRGFVVELLPSDGCSGNPTTDDCEDRGGSGVQQPMGISVGKEEEAEDDKQQRQPPLMLKMKFLPYMVRTFGCRNGLRILLNRNDGVGGEPPEASFLKYTKNLLTKWKMPVEAQQTWLPYFKAWAVYVKRNTSLSQAAAAGASLQDKEEHEKLPPLNSIWYLDHLNYFEQLYYDKNSTLHQYIDLANSSSSTKPKTSTCTFAGLVVVVAFERSAAIDAANKIKEQLGVIEDVVPHLKKVSPERLLLACEKGQGIVAVASINEGSGALRKLLKEKPDAVSLVLVGCSETEILSSVRGSDELVSSDEHEKLCKKTLGMANAWRKCKCTCVIDLPLHSADIVACDNASEARSDNEKIQTPMPNSSIPELNMIIERVQEVSSKMLGGSDDGDNRIGLLVFFPAGIPGCGKSSLLDSMTVVDELRRYVIGSIITKKESNSETQPSPKGEKPKGDSGSGSVVVRVGDQVKGRYWQLVTVERLKDKSCVAYIADKNAPSAAWGDIARITHKTKSLAVPVLPAHILKTTRIKGVRTVESGSILKQEYTEHVYPFSLNYLAVCMSRVLNRPPGSHLGKLDSGTKRACLVVVKFFSLYRNLSAEAFCEVLENKFTQEAAACISPPILVPFFSSSDDGAESQKLPDGLEAVLIESIQAYYGCEMQNIEATKNAVNHQYLDDLENRLRISIEKHQACISKMTIDIATSRQKLVSQLIEVMCQSKNLRSYPSLSSQSEATMRSSFVKLAAVDVETESVHKILQSHIDDERFIPFWDIVLKGRESSSSPDTVQDAISSGPNFVGKMHVTMAHFLQMEQAVMKATFGPLCGSKVNIRVSALLWNERVAALEVTVLGCSKEEYSSSPVPSPQNRFPHITIWHSSDAQAKESNDLPAQVDSGKAYRICFEDPVELTGIISLWTSI